MAKNGKRTDGQTADRSALLAVVLGVLNAFMVDGGFLKIAKAAASYAGVPFALATTVTANGRKRTEAMPKTQWLRTAAIAAGVVPADIEAIDGHKAGWNDSPFVELMAAYGQSDPQFKAKLADSIATQVTQYVTDKAAGNVGRSSGLTFSGPAKTK